MFFFCIQTFILLCCYCKYCSYRNGNWAADFLIADKFESLICGFFPSAAEGCKICLYKILLLREWPLGIPNMSTNRHFSNCKWSNFLKLLLNCSIGRLTFIQLPINLNSSMVCIFSIKNLVLGPLLRVRLSKNVDVYDILKTVQMYII